MLRRLMDAMGGEDAVGAIRAISLEGTMTRPTPGSGSTVARIKTFVKFPDMYRQELELPAGKVTTLIGPSGAWIVSGKDAPLPLPTERRLEIENIILRNPIALLKTRESELFSAVAPTPAQGSSGPQVLIIKVGSKQSTITLDARGLIETMSYEMPGSGPVHPRLTVTYSDYRPVGSVQYPFASKAVSEGTPMYSVELKSAKANELLPGTMFDPTTGGARR